MKRAAAAKSAKSKGALKRADDEEERAVGTAPPMSAGASAGAGAARAGARSSAAPSTTGLAGSADDREGEGDQHAGPTAGGGAPWPSTEKWASELRSVENRPTVVPGYMFILVEAYSEAGTADMPHKNFVPRVNHLRAGRGQAPLGESNISARAGDLRAAMPAIRALASAKNLTPTSPATQLEAFAKSEEVQLFLRKVGLHVHGSDLMKMVLAVTCWPEAQMKPARIAAEASAPSKRPHPASSSSWAAEDGGGAEPTAAARIQLAADDAPNPHKRRLETKISSLSTALFMIKEQLRGLVAVTKAIAMHLEVPTEGLPSDGEDEDDDDSV